MRTLHVEVTLNGEDCAKTMRLSSNDTRGTREIPAQEIRDYFEALGYEVGQYVRIL